MKQLKRIFTGLASALCAVAILPVGLGSSGLFTDNILTVSADWEWKSELEEAIYHKLTALPFGSFTDGNGSYVYGSRSPYEHYMLGSFGTVTSWGNTVVTTEDGTTGVYVCDNLHVLDGILCVTFDSNPMAEGANGSITQIQFTKNNVTYTYRPVSEFEWDVHIGDDGLTDSELESISYEEAVVYNIKPETYANANGTLTPLAAASETVTTHKLGVLDTERNSFGVSTTVFSDDVVYVPFMGAKTGDDERISAIITDNQDNVLAYARLVIPTSEYGTVAVKLPDGFNQGYNSLYIFNEEYKAGADNVLTSHLQKVEFSSWVNGSPSSESGVLRKLYLTTAHYTNGDNSQSAEIDLRARTVETRTVYSVGSVDEVKNDSLYHIWNVTVDADVLQWNLVKNVDTKNYQTLTWDPVNHVYTTGTGGVQSETVSYSVDTNDTATKTLSITNDSNFSIRRSVSIDNDKFTVAESNAAIATASSANSSITIDPTKFSGFDEYSYTSVGTAVISLTADGDIQSYTGS